MEVTFARGRPRNTKEVRDGPVLSSAEPATATQAAKVRVETMDLARRQATSCARVLLTISESVQTAARPATCRDRFCLGPTERAPCQASVRGAAQPAQPTTDPARPSCLKSSRF